jgi:FKBP-type peptidyl-prolyl cis-trans isomerase
MKMYKTILFSTLILTLLSCGGGYSEEEKAKFDAEIQTIIEEGNLNMDRLENGLYIDIIKTGHGDELIKITDEVTFSYTGYHSDGSVFQTIKDDEPLTFPVRSLIVGWQDALSFVSKGGELKVIIPPHLGYGSKNTELVPPNSILIYDMKVIDVK